MGQDPSEIRAAIEATRERMSETIDALVYKTDVKARAAEVVDERVDAAKHSLAQTLQAAKAGAASAAEALTHAAAAAGAAASEAAAGAANVVTTKIAGVAARIGDAVETGKSAFAEHAHTAEASVTGVHTSELADPVREERPIAE